MNSRDGFTLLEAILVVTVLGAIAAIALPRWTERGSRMELEQTAAAIASVQRSSTKCSLHSWNTPPARQTRSITRPMRRSDVYTTLAASRRTRSPARDASSTGRTGRRGSVAPDRRPQDDADR